MDDSYVRDALDALSEIMGDKSARTSERVHAARVLLDECKYHPGLDPSEPEPVRLATEQFNALIDLMWSVARVVRDDSETYGPVNERYRLAKRRAYALLVSGEE